MSTPSIDRTGTDWDVLLIGGASGTGKTVAAQRLARHFGISCLEVDDIRLALQYSHVKLPLPEGTSALYFFMETADVWRLPPERLCDALIDVARVLLPALEIVIANHVGTKAPVIIEGDGILPSLLTRSLLRGYTENGRVRAIFLVEPDEAVLRANIVARKRGVSEWDEEELNTQVRTSLLYGQWLAAEARRHGLQVLESRPWPTLAERIVMTS